MDAPELGQLFFSARKKLPVSLSVLLLGPMKPDPGVAGSLLGGGGGRDWEGNLESFIRGPRQQLAVI